jgi:iron complex transport system substrate-binding protein
MMHTSSFRSAFSAWFPVLILVTILSSCQTRSGHKTATSKVVVSGDTLELKYAKGFRVRTIRYGIRLVDIADPTDKHKQEPYRLALVPRGVSVQEVPDDYSIHITVPVKRVLPMSTEFLSHFIALDAIDYVTAITSVRHLKNKEVNERVKQGRIARIGYEGSFDLETVLAARPDLVFISPFKKGGYDVIRQAGVPLVPVLLFKEQTPLGQAEWIKFFALFIGKEQQADRWFSEVARQYNFLKKLASRTSQRPTVFAGELRNSSWFIMGSRSYLAEMIRDAGARYIPDNDESTGGHPIDYEALLRMAAHADYWRLLKSYPGKFSYQALQEMDTRTVNFDAFRRHKVVYCNMGSSGYHEWASIRPDWLLADFIYAFHPNLLPRHHPRFYAVLSS